MSRIGLVLCLAYVGATVCCVVAAFWGADAKGQFVLLQLPIALQVALLDSAGLGSLLQPLSWPAAYALLALPTAALLYLVGALLSRRRSNQSFQRTASGGR